MIRLSEEQRQAIEGHGVQEFPRECCGVLLGDVEDGHKIVREVRPVPNTFEPSLEFERSAATDGAEVELHGQERRYMVSPETMFQLMQEERRTRRKILGFYHSHPDHPARPSEYDRAWAMNWYSYIIVSILQGTPADLTCWQLSEDGQTFTAEEICGVQERNASLTTISAISTDCETK